MYIFHRRGAFGGEVGSLICDAGSEYLTWPDHADLDFAGDFCIEAWVRFLSVAAGMTIIAHGGRGNDITDYVGWNMKWFTSNNLYWGLRLGSTNYDKSFSFTPVINTWYHLAFNRSGNDMTAWANGSQAGSTQTVTNNINEGAYPLRIGIAQDNSQALYANVDECRISGASRYTAPFTPSAVPFAVDGDTRYLIHFNGPSASTTFPDEGGHGNASVFGAARVDTSIYKW